jgi:hypothetical protein
MRASHSGTVSGNEAILGTLRLGDLTVSFGAMRITGPGIWARSESLGRLCTKDPAGAREMLVGILLGDGRGGEPNSSRPRNFTRYGTSIFHNPLRHFQAPALVVTAATILTAIGADAALGRRRRHAAQSAEGDRSVCRVRSRRTRTVLTRFRA